MKKSLKPLYIHPSILLCVKCQLQQYFILITKLVSIKLFLDNKQNLSCLKQELKSVELLERLFGQCLNNLFSQLGPITLVI